MSMLRCWMCRKEYDEGSSVMPRACSEACWADLKKLEARANEMLAKLPPVEHLVVYLRGRDGKLRPSKPTKATGAVRYIWRMARFHSGEDPCMPVMAFFDLANWAKEHAPDAQVDGIINHEGRALLDACDALADAVLGRFGMTRYGAAKRWAGLLY